MPNDPSDRVTRLSGRHLSILDALVVIRVEMQGGDVEVRRVQEAREVLAHVTLDELDGLRERLGEEFVSRWTEGSGQ